MNILYKEPLIQKGKIKFNWTLFVCTLVIVLFGILMIYSASCYNANKTFGSSYYFVNKQVIGFVIGLIGLLFCSRLNYEFLSKLMYPALFLGIGVLVFVLIPGIGIELYGARRWINCFGVSFQASEISKFCFIIFTASYMSKNKDKMNTFVGCVPVLCVGGILCFLIMLEPNMSITICTGILMIVMLFSGGIKLKHLGLLGICICAIIPILIISEPYRLQRLMAFIDPWANPQGEGFQLIQSLYALGNGGWFGVGLFNSRQKYSFLPFSESDFIFSIIGEELGLVGSICVLLIFAVIIIQGYKIAFHAKDRLGCYLSIGITTIIAVQVLLNVAVVTGLVPPTGLPLPFVSAGGTSLVMFMSAIGVLLNIYKQNNLI